MLHNTMHNTCTLMNMHNTVHTRFMNIEFFCLHYISSLNIEHWIQRIQTQYILSYLALKMHIISVHYISSEIYIISVHWTLNIAALKHWTLNIELKHSTYSGTDSYTNLSSVSIMNIEFFCLHYISSLNTEHCCTNTLNIEHWTLNIEFKHISQFNYWFDYI